MIIFIFNIICFCLAVSVKAFEHKDSVLFFHYYQFRSYTIHNIQGHVYCGLLAINCLFILVSVSMSGLQRYIERPVLIDLNV
jgi:hypothetical protein